MGREPRSEAEPEQSPGEHSSSASNDSDWGWDATLPLDQELARQLLRIDRYRHAMRSLGMLHTADLRLLWLLCSGPPRTLREIGEAFRLEQSTVNRQVNAAIRAGLVERFAESGRTARLVAPTPEGRRRFETDIEQSLRIYRRALTTLGDDSEQARFLSQLAAFTSSYSEAIDAELGPPC